VGAPDSGAVPVESGDIWVGRRAFQAGGTPAWAGRSAPGAGVESDGFSALIGGRGAVQDGSGDNDMQVDSAGLDGT